MTKNFCNSNHILVGLGGTGGKILRAFKMRMFEEFPEQEERNKLPVALMYIDSTSEMMPKDGRARADFRVMGQDASFTNNEFLNIKAVDVEHILDHIDNFPSVKGIVDNVSAVKGAIGSLGKAAGQKRRAGRLLFAANAVGYVNCLRNANARCESVSGDSSRLNIHIFAGLAGGTGSGSVVDVVLQSRKTFPNAKISVYAMIPEMNLPEDKTDMDQGRYYQNGYAAMNELNALQVGRWDPQDVTGRGNLNLYNDRVKGVADGLTVYSNVNENGLTINSLEELPKVVSDYMFARIFFVNEEDNVNSDIIRAYNFENMDEFALEFDETSVPAVDGKLLAARTKKINSFGIKRVIYPELRVLKHITYTIGESVLFQFKYNNWRENQGYVDEEKNKDYRREYLNEANLAAWMLDEEHLLLDKKILEADTDYPGFKEYWHDKAIGYAEDAKKSKDPLNELDDILKDFYDKHFREDGVEAFYRSKERVIPEMAREIRHKIESELFEKWKIGDVSVEELLKVSKLIQEKMDEIRKDLDTKATEESANYKAIDNERAVNVEDKNHLGMFQKLVKSNDMFNNHKSILEDLYLSKTMLVALDFAKKLAAKLAIELGKMNTDISAFGQKINDAIAETKKLVTAQRKVNKGLEDMKGAIIEVSEEEAMADFETELRTDKVDMPIIARNIREAILPEGDFYNFGRLTDDISIDSIKDAFDIKLAELVRIKHNEKADSERKVLGLNILTQLRQKLRTDDDIKAFAVKIVNQSGVYLKLDNNQITQAIHNNEGILSPQNPASINKKAILISIPSPDDNPGLKSFADKLEYAFKTSINQSIARTTITVNRKSPRKDELSIITVGYCFPMRAIEWLSTYKQRYENFLHTGNKATDDSNAILLHSEGDGTQFPSMFMVENWAQIIAEKEAMLAKSEPADVSTSSSTSSSCSQPRAEFPSKNGGDTELPPPPPPKKEDIKLYLAIGTKQYGPYTMEQCGQMVEGGQLTEKTMVWKAGMAAWEPAGHVEELKPLFAPPAIPGMPPLPPSEGPTPPPLF